MARRQATTSSHHTTSTRDSRASADSCDRPSTAATSLYDSPRPSTKSCGSRASKGRPASYEDDLSYSTSLYPRSSADTYSSRNSVSDSQDAEVDEAWEANEIPPLPVYRQGIADTSVRPSNPEDFAALFPSMNRLSIHHDDLTPDGNMNLRIDTTVTGRKRRTYQLFHLRMYDLNKRDFSLRRYCRESGREVCHSKRKYEDAPAPSRPALERSVSTVMQMGRPKPPTRTNTNSSMFSAKSRPSTSYSAAEADDEFNGAASQSMTPERRAKPRQVATNSIKLDFSNYARVDVQRCGSGSTKRYDFEWWGHKYSWKRSVDKLTGAVSFHLMRDGSSKHPVAHIVPESRTPSQIADDEYAGGWIPPCHMWISDQSLIEAVTDVADVVVASGLIALVDDCIKERWGTKKAHHRPLGLPLPTKPVDINRPRAFVQYIIRRDSGNSARSFRHHNAVAAY